ncbi:MAG: virulence protein SciE type [Burkholderiaceae bacterium]|nr:virulence protein SciE type [Burkholderiaceae bacterium]
MAEEATLKAMMDAATAAARSAPTDASARMKLFRLFAVTGQWERAKTQLDTASNLDTSLGFTAMVYKQAIACERFRTEVFQGRRTPVIAGEPPQWLALMVEALRADSGGSAGGASLRAQALESARASAGRLDGTAFEWVADADSRLGPVCECFIDGKYYWVPFERIARLGLSEPDDVLEMVWASAEITFSGGGEKHALIPVRYPGSESSDDDAIRLARKTVWEGSDEQGWRGLGQRVWATDEAEVAMLDVRQIELG